MKEYLDGEATADDFFSGVELHVGKDRTVLYVKIVERLGL